MSTKAKEYASTFYQLMMFTASFIGKTLLIIIFYCVFMPIGFMMRLLDIDPLQCKRKSTTETYYRKSKERSSRHMDNSY